MDYKLTDSSGTDDDHCPRHRKFQRGRPAAAVNDNGRVYGDQLSRFNGNMESQIHLIVREAYYFMLRAFSAQSDTISWEQQDLISQLRKELNVSDDEHCELISRVSADGTIQRIRELRKADGRVQTGVVSSRTVRDPVPSTSVSGSRKRERTSQSGASLSLGAPSPRMHLSSSVLRQGPPNAKNKKPKAYPPAGPGKLPVPNKGNSGASSEPKFVQYPPAGPGKAPVPNKGNSGAIRANARAETATRDPLIGRKVWTRWPEDNQFYEAFITDYNPSEGQHALVYDRNTANESWEWVNLKEISQEDIKWEGEDPGVYRRSGQPGASQGTKKFVGREGAISGTGRGRGSIKGHSKKDLQVPQNRIANKALGDIKILDTKILIKKVEKVFGASHPNPTEIDKASKLLKEQEQALLDAIRRLEDISDD